MRPSRTILGLVAVLALLLLAGLWFLRDSTGELAPRDVGPVAGGVGPQAQLNVDVGEDPARAALDAAAQASASAAGKAGSKSEAEQRLLLRGHVVDVHDVPVPGAIVELSLPPARELQLLLDHELHDRHDKIDSTATDERGAFEFAAPRGRPLDLVASKEGLASAHLESVYAGQDVKLVVRAGTSIVGRVTRKQDGAPVAGAEVLVMHDEVSGTVFAGRTDAGGQYAARGLPPGGANVLIVPVLERQVYREVELVSGQELVLDVQVVSGAILTGEVRDAVTDQPIAGAEVSSWSFLHKTVRTGPDGRYRIDGVQEQHADASARAAGYGPESASSLPFVAGQFQADFKLWPARSVHGRVVDSAERPIAGAYVAVVGSALEMRGDAHGGEEQVDVHPTRTGIDGRFEFADLVARARHFAFVRAFGHGDAYVPFPESDRAATHDIELGDIYLPASASVEGFIVGNDADAEAIAAQRAPSDPIANAGIELHLEVDVEQPTSPWAGRNPFVASFRQAASDEHGRFAFADLAAGHYRLRFYRDGLKVLEDVKLDLAPGEARRDFVAVMRRNLSITGRVLDPWGSALRGAFVFARKNGTNVRIESNAQGEFELAGLEREPYLVEADFWGPYELNGTSYELAPVLMEGVQAGTQSLVLQLRRAAAIEGQVLDEQGTPVDHAGYEARRSDGVLVEQGFCNDQGRFRLRVAEESRVDLSLHPVQRLEGLPPRWRMLTGTPRSVRVPGVAAGAKDLVVRLGADRTPR